MLEPRANGPHRPRASSSSPYRGYPRADFNAWLAVSSMLPSPVNLCNGEGSRRATVGRNSKKVIKFLIPLDFGKKLKKKKFRYPS